MSKKIFITGSTDGIGKLTALKLAKDEHQIILHGRNAKKIGAVIEEIKEAADNEKVTGYVADLADLTAVKDLAKQVINANPEIDVLINNAGVYVANPPRDATGMDLRFLVNYLAPVLLTRELYSVLAGGNNPRVINLSSAAQAPVSLPALRGEESLTEQAAYSQSKLALTMWNSAMADKYPDITFIAVNPGSLLNTKMVKEAFGRHYSPADKGADILVKLATSSEHTDKSGRYFDNDRGAYGTPHADAKDHEEIARLLRVTNNILP